jgi:hypothetical protein
LVSLTALNLTLIVAGFAYRASRKAFKSLLYWQDKANFLTDGSVILKYAAAKAKRSELKKFSNLT